MKINEHTINLPLLYCGNLSAAKEQCFLWDEGGKTHLSSPHPRLGYSPWRFGQQHTLHLLKQHKCARTNYVLGDRQPGEAAIIKQHECTRTNYVLGYRQPGEAAIKDELNIISSWWLAMVSYSPSLAKWRHVYNVRWMQDARHRLQVFNLVKQHIQHVNPMTETYCWCITDVFADVSLRSLSPIMATGTPQLVWKRLLVHM